MANITRFGVSLPEELVDRFDSLTKKMGYFNRSKALRDAISDFIAQKEWSSKVGKSSFVATLSFSYDHHVGDTSARLTELQHDFGGCVVSNMHAHVTHHDCAEVLILRGCAKDLRALADGISAIRGVTNCKLSILSEI